MRFVSTLAYLYAAHETLTPSHYHHHNSKAVLLFSMPLSAIILQLSSFSYSMEPTCTQNWQWVIANHSKHLPHHMTPMLIVFRMVATH